MKPETNFCNLSLKAPEEEIEQATVSRAGAKEINIVDVAEAALFFWLLVFSVGRNFSWIL